MEFSQYFMVFVKWTGMKDQQNTQDTVALRAQSTATEENKTQIDKTFHNTSAEFRKKNKNAAKSFQEAKPHWKKCSGLYFFIPVAFIMGRA